MNRIDRLTAILLQLQSQRLVRGKEIADRFGICMRTVYRDIRALEDAGVPIGSEPGMGYFLAPGYHLPPVMFAEKEARALLTGGKLIEKFSDMAINRDYACALDKIKAMMGNPEKERLNTLASHIEVLKYAPRSGMGISESLLPDLQEVLGRNRIIHIAYTSAYKNEATQRDVEPLGLCFYAGHWHLLAFCRLRHDYRDFRVDRIQSVQHTGKRFDPQQHEELPKLIREMVAEPDVKPATVRFERSAIPYVGDQKYFFGLVKEKNVGPRVEMHFLTSSYEILARWLLGYVDAVEVISPDALRQLMADHADRLFAHYHPIPSKH